MGSARFIVAVLLLVVIVRSHGFIEIQRAPTPDSNIKGRLLTVAEGCGLPKLTSIKRIVGGGPAKNGAWPWVTLLGNIRGDRFFFHCGGSLITTRHILSAAHCFVNLTTDYARLGEYDYHSLADGEHVDVAINSFKMHEYYEDRTFINDIAIVYIAKDVKFTDRIRPICLPTSKDMRNRSFVGTNPFVVGWGYLRENTTMTNVLQQAQVPVISNDECKRQNVNVTRLFYGAQYRFSEKYIICTGFLAGGVSPCSGDSGGPLMLPINDNGRFSYYQIGIVSNAVGCARSNAPAMLTNVSKYVDWILDKLQQS